MDMMKDIGEVGSKSGAFNADNIYARNCAGDGKNERETVQQNKHSFFLMRTRRMPVLEAQPIIILQNALQIDSVHLNHSTSLLWRNTLKRATETLGSIPVKSVDILPQIDPN